MKEKVFFSVLIVFVILLDVFLSPWMNQHLERLMLKLFHLCVFQDSFAFTACAFVFIWLQSKVMNACNWFSHCRS